MIEGCTQVLDLICTACIVVTAAVSLVAIWVKVDNEVIWQIVGSGLVLFMAAGSMPAINAHVLKMRMERASKKTDKSEHPIRAKS